MINYHAKQADLKKKQTMGDFFGVESYEIKPNEYIGKSVIRSLKPVVCCNECNLMFKDKEAYLAHVATHTQWYACKTCHQSFKYIDVYKQHMHEYHCVTVIEEVETESDPLA